MSQESIANSQDRMTEVMIKHMCMGYGNYNIVNVLRSIGQPTPEKLLELILQNERENEKTIEDLKEQVHDFDERLNEAVEEAVEEKDGVIEEMEEGNKKLKEELSATNTALEILKEENKKLKEQVEQEKSKNSDLLHFIGGNFHYEDNVKEQIKEFYSEEFIKSNEDQWEQVCIDWN